MCRTQLDTKRTGQRRRAAEVFQHDNVLYLFHDDRDELKDGGVDEDDHGKNTAENLSGCDDLVLPMKTLLRDSTTCGASVDQALCVVCGFGEVSDSARHVVSELPCTNSFCGSHPNNHG